MGKQVILTATLKEEESRSQKYTSDPQLNALDYSDHDDCKIMQSKNTSAFMEILNSFQGLVV